MKVYFKQGWGISFTLCGVLLFCANMWLISVGHGQPLQLLVCAMLTLIGIMYLVQPYFELRSNEIVLFNRLGMEAKRYPFDSYSDLQVIDGKVYVNMNGKSRKVNIGKFMAKNQEWERFIGIITSEGLTNELHNI